MKPLRLAMFIALLIGCLTTCSYLAGNEAHAVSRTNQNPAMELIVINSYHNILIIHDHTTGCQYIQTARGIYPRMQADGRQYCLRNEDDFPDTIPSKNIPE
jgi:hypothetical protein